MPTGAIVAGGRSTRFGDADKAVAELAGTPMIRRVADRLAGTGVAVEPGGAAASDGDAVIDDLVINSRPDQREPIEAAMEGYPLDVTYAEDDEPDLGPMAGIRNACRAASAEFVFVVACDMPFVDPTFASHLFELASGHDAAVPQLEDEWYQTTQAVYRATPMADACDAALDQGKRKVIEPLFELDHVVVSDTEIRATTTERTFTNVNTQAELRDAEQRYQQTV